MANFAYQGRQGKTARTAWKLLHDLKGYALLEVELFTGRTHQIRTHLAHIGHPILHDWLYGERLAEDDPLAPFLSRQALHAACLGFQHPTTREWLSFDAPLPADIQSAVDFLKTPQALSAPNETF